MYSSASSQFHRLLDKAFLKQLSASACAVFPDIWFEIYDANGNLFFTHAKTDNCPAEWSEAPITIDNQAAGRLRVGLACHNHRLSSQELAAAAQCLGLLLSRLAQAQWERRCIAQDSLNRYRELALLHQLGEKMGSCLDPDALADIILAEVRKITRASAGALLLGCPEAGGLSAAASFGSENISAELKTAALRLAEIVFAGGRSELIDAACSDPRLAAIVTCDCAPLLCVPLKIENRMLGVLSLIAKPDDTCFSSEDMKLTEVIAAHAANAFETARLFKELENMAYAIILAASATIDERDACTAGHSTRVADISLAIAARLNQASLGGRKLPAIKLQELEYAALLHDIGKIGVPEAILTKRSRLSADRMLAIKARFDFITVTTGQKLTQEYALLEETNQAHTISPEACRQVKALTERTYTNLEGAVQPFLLPEEEEALCVPRGNLIQQEFRQIQTHAEKSYRILRQIPFPAHLRRIPHIAYQHHERLNGTGYPNGLTTEEILLESKILSVADVFEALTATDRPYRSPVSVEKALEILRSEATGGYLDKEVVDTLAALLRTDTKWFTSLDSRKGGTQHAE